MRQPLFVGTYSIPSSWAGAASGHGAGIVAVSIELATGEMFADASHFETDPAFIVADSALGQLFSVTEVERGGELLSLASTDGQTFGRRRSIASGADGPGHVAIDATHRAAFVSHFHGGFLSVVGLDQHGAPSRVLEVVELPSHARGVERSGRSRPHCSVVIDDNFLLVADFGRDLLALFEITTSSVRAGLRVVDALALPEGLGPRHIAYRRSDPMLYVSNENAASISVIRARTDRDPALELVGIEPSPGLGREVAFPSEIAFHPTFDTIYMANRRDNSLSVFAIDPSDRTISQRQAVDVRGEWPRHFALSPDGRLLVVGNQDSDTLVSFHVRPGGDLEWSGHELSLASPAAVAFW